MTPPRGGGAAILLLLAGCAPSAPAGSAGPAPGPRVIMVSFDALNEDRLRTTLDPAAIPTFLSLFDRASCADGARSMFPSITAPSHAALWTGVYGSVNGVVANTQPVLPLGEHALTEQMSGFDARQLAAEPIWIAAARSGRRVMAYHVTQAGVPGRWLPGGGRDTAGLRRHSAALAEHLWMNGYTGGPEPRLLRSGRTPARPAPPWVGAGSLGNDQPLREVSWAVGRDSLHALFFGTGGYREAVVSASRDIGRGVRVRSAPVERAPLGGRELARHFSDVLWMDTPDGPAGMYFRLWDLAPDLSDWQLYQSARSVVRTNQPAALATYQQAVGGFVPNPAPVVLRESGPAIQAGGDGTAELKYLETAELQTRQFIRGSRWVWQHRRPDLQTEYFSLGDGLDHTWLGLVTPTVPGVTREIAERVGAMRNRGWSLVDARLAALDSLARDGGALLVVAGDHGMRPTWKAFNVNSLLRDGGLLVTRGDDPRRPDLARSRALSPTGYFVNLNHRARKDGIVAPAEAEPVADSVVALLASLRGPDGSRVVPRTWRPVPDDSLGIGGAAGGDVYFSLAPGYAYSATLADSVITGREPHGSHGHPSIERDMLTVLCAIGPGVGGRRLPTARIIDAAPTVSSWLRIGPPLDARGVSLLDAMRAP
jgi:predicted AlkP superfamily phosphohydrolase/phosphomutase